MNGGGGVTAPPPLRPPRRPPFGGVKITALGLIWFVTRTSSDEECAARAKAGPSPFGLKSRPISRWRSTRLVIDGVAGEAQNARATPSPLFRAHTAASWAGPVGSP